MPVLVKPSSAARRPRARAYEPARTDQAAKHLLSSLSGGDPYVYDQLKNPRLPTSMMQPVTFHGEDDDRVTLMRLCPVDETEDQW